MTTRAEAPFLDITRPGFEWEQPEVARAREANWYATTPLGVIVLRHAEVEELLRDRRFVKGAERYMAMHGVESGPLYDWWTNSFQNLGPADHARIRGLVGRAFSPRLVEDLRPFVRETAERLVDGIADGVCEAVAAFTEPLPALVMCRMLGVPPADYDLFHRYSSDIALAYGGDLSNVRPRVEAAVLGLSEYVQSLVADRRRDPGDDLISTLTELEQDGDRLTTDELRDLLMVLIWAGQDTTARQLGRALVAFSGHADQWSLLARRPELAPQAVEEVCRWSPQARTSWRFAAADVEYHGLHVPAGGIMLLCVVAANRDPRAFDAPERFDIAADRRAKNVTFGGGMTYCLGANVARLEMAEGLRALTARHGPPEIAGPVTWSLPTAFIHGPLSLPLRFT